MRCKQMTMKKTKKKDLYLAVSAFIITFASALCEIWTRSLAE